MKIKSLHPLLALFIYVSTCVLGHDLDPIIKEFKSNPTISLDMKDQSINDAIRLLSGSIGLNILIGDDVNGKVNLSVQNATASDILKAIIDDNELSYIWKNRILHILPKEKTSILLEPFNSSASSTFSLTSQGEFRLSDIEFIEQDLRDALSLFAAISKTNVLIDDSVNETITVRFSDISIREAFSAFFERFYLEWKWIGNILIIRSRADRPRESKTLFLNNIQAKDFFWVAQEMLSSVGTITANIASNCISINDRKENVLAIQKLALLVDRLNGRLVASSPFAPQFVLRNGNSLVLGNSEIRFRYEQPEGATASHFFGVYLGRENFSDYQTIGQIDFPGSVIGSGTINDVQVECLIQIRAINNSTKENIPFHY